MLLLSWLQVGAFGGAGPLDEPGALAECVQDSRCIAPAGDLAADFLRDAAASAEGVAVGLSPAIVRGEGFTMELSAQSFALPTPKAPEGVAVAPVVPRLGLGGFVGQRIRAGGGLQGGALVPLDGADMGFTFGGRGGLALSAPGERWWVGLEGDVGYSIVRGTLIEDPDAVAEDVSGLALDVRDCIGECPDVLTLLHAGVDSVFTLDVDSTTSLFGRVGAVFQDQAFDVGVDGSTWGWSGLLPRMTLGASYRPQTRVWLSAAVRLGALERNLEPGYALLSLASLGLGYRFGAEPPPPTVMPPPRVEKTTEELPPVLVPKIPIVEHPDLACGPDQIPTGAPPPLGLEGWCVIIDERGHVLPDGLYLKWHDPERIAVKGENHLGRPSGTWTEFHTSGTLASYGAYSDGLKEGVWRTYFASGQPETEGTYHRGQQTDEWRFWTEDGRGSTEGRFLNGARDGQWRDYRDNELVRLRTYRDGNLVSDELFAVPR